MERQRRLWILVLPALHCGSLTLQCGSAARIGEV